MWSHSTDLDFNFSSMKSLEEYSNLDLNAFYEEFTDDKNQCLEISEDVWK
jgi:hypothetical protein